MLSLALASLLLSQSATPVAAEVDLPTVALNAEKPIESLKARIFVIEYPIYISDLVADYTNCLRSQNVDIGPGRTFEAEHRNAVPLCAKKEQRNKKEAFELLSSRPKSSMTMEQLGNLFDNIKVTHIDRGRVMDGFMDRGFDADPYAKQVGKAQETPVDLATPSVGA